MSINRLKTEHFEWIFIDRVRQKDIDFLKEKYDFHPLDLEDCLSVSQRPKIDIYDNYIFMVLHFPYYIKESKRVDFREVHFFVGKNYIVTVKKVKTDPLHSFFEDFSAGKIKLNSSKQNPFHFLYKVLEKLFEEAMPITDTISKNLVEIEDEIFNERSRSPFKKVAVTRRNILNYIKMVKPEIGIFDRLIGIRKSYIPKGISVYFDDIQDYLERIKASLDNYRDIIEGLGQTHESLISHQTNQVMKILTVISVGLLPLTLVASIYGMNISGLPFAKQPVVIWIFFTVLIFFISLIIFISHKRNIL